jgi:hypothetical protein
VLVVVVLVVVVVVLVGGVCSRVHHSAVCVHAWVCSMWRAMQGTTH